MYIRCSDCYGTLWLDEGAGTESDHDGTCGPCGGEFRLEIAERVGCRVELAHDARMFGRSQQIDLPSAYSVLLGAMTLEQVKDLAAWTRFSGVRPTPVAEAETPSVAASPRSGARPVRFEFDPDFKPAVDRGDLTPRMASERGQREALVLRLMERHQLSREAAEHVADNRMSLLAAVRQRKKRPDAQSKHTMRYKPKRKTRPLVAAAMAVGATLSIGAYAMFLWVGEIQSAHQASLRTVQPTATAATEHVDVPVPALDAQGAPAAGIRVIADRDGEPLEIEARTAKAVLLTYCDTGSDANFLEPVALASTASPQRGLIYGIVKDWRMPDETHAIQIRQDHKSRRWITGDRMVPIRKIDPADLRLDEQRTPVYAAAF